MNVDPHRGTLVAGGFGGMRGGGFAMRGAGPAFGGFAVRNPGAGRVGMFNGGGRVAMFNGAGRRWNNNWHNGHGNNFRHRRVAFVGVPFGFAAGYWPDYYGYGYDDCYQTVRVASAYGPVWRTVNVCEY